MRDTMLVFIVCLLLLAVSAAHAGAPAGWYTNLPIKYVYGGAVGGRAAVGVTTSIPQGSCPSTGTSEFSIDVNSQFGWAMWSIVLLAYSKGLTISIYTDGTCSSNGLNGTDVAVGPVL
jgi:hypothetical protein